MAIPDLKPKCCLQLTRIVALLGILIHAAWPAKEDFRLSLARRLVQQGELEKGIQEYRTYLGENPNSPEVFKEMGEVRSGQGNFKLAAQNFKQALGLKPDFWEAQRALAEAYEKGGDKEKAVIEWRRLANMVNSPSLKEESEKRIESLLQTLHDPQPVAPTEEMPVAAESPEATPAPEPVAGSTPKGDAFPSEKASSPKSEPIADEKPEAAQTSAQNATAETKGLYGLPEFQEAKRQHEAGNDEKALVAIHSTLKKSPGHPGAYYLAGVIRYNRNQLDMSEFNFKRSFSYPDKGFNANFYLGRIYERQGQWKQAADAFRTYIQLTDSEKGKNIARKHMEDAMAKMGDAPKEAALTQKESAQPDRAKTLAVSEPMAMALDSVFPIFVADANGVGATAMKEATDLFNSGKFEQALQKTKQVKLQYAGSPNAAISVLNLASLYGKMGLAENSLKQAETFLNLHAKEYPDYREIAEFLRAHALVQLGQHQEAEGILRTLKGDGKNGPGQRTIQTMLSEVLHERKEFPQAVKLLEKAVQATEDPRERQVMYLRAGEMALEARDYGHALELLEKAAKNCEDDGKALCDLAGIRRADIFYRQKKMRDALREYENLAQMAPGHAEIPWIRYQIANIYREQNEFDKALAEYKRVMDEYSESYWAAQSKWKREDTIWEREYQEVLD